MTKKELALRQAEQDRDRHYENAITWKKRALSAEAKVARAEYRIGFVAQWLIDRAALSHDPMTKSGLIAASRYVDENLRAALDGDE